MSKLTEFYKKHRVQYYLRRDKFYFWLRKLDKYGTVIETVLLTIIGLEIAFIVYKLVGV